MEKRQAGAERPRESAQEAREAKQAGASLVAELARRRAAANATPPDAPPQSQTPQIDAPAPGKSPPIAKAESPKPSEFTEAQRKLLKAGDAIFRTAATTEDKAYLARELVLASLPHKNPGNQLPVWTRRNGDVVLGIQPGVNLTTKASYGYPYGSIPRLLLFFVTTEALRVGRRLELGSSLNGFMLQLGLSPLTGRGKRGDAKRLREQMERLFFARFSLQRVTESDQHRRQERIDMQVAPLSELWWNTRAPDQGGLFESWIELGEEFYKAVTSAPVPADMRALRALKQSPLALDLYAWLTFEAFRAHKSGKRRFETWTQLHAHMGGEYAEVRNFRLKVKAALRKIRVVYPKLKLGVRRGGLEVLPESYPAIQPRESSLIEATLKR